MTTEKSKAIGIFDSGIGGLTVLKEVRRLLPGENIIYLGDTARVPYGTKSKETVLKYTIQNTLFLLEKGVKAIVVACNTASAFGLPSIESHFRIPIIGVIKPGAKKAVASSKSKNVAIIGTEGTVRSRVYEDEIRKLDASFSVWAKACPLLVGLAEEGWQKGAVVDGVLQEYLHELKSTSIDSLIMGCTHYPLLKESIQKMVGDKISLIDSGVEAAHELKSSLEQQGLLSASKKGSTQFYSTDSPERMQRIGHSFLGAEMPPVEKVEISV